MKFNEVSESWAIDNFLNSFFGKNFICLGTGARKNELCNFQVSEKKATYNSKTSRFGKSLNTFSNGIGIPHENSGTVSSK